MARYLALALTLCGLAASATAFTAHGRQASPAQLAELSAIHGDVQTMVEQGADLVNALTADANRYHSLAAMSPGAECFHTAWDAFIATVYRAHDINMKVRDLAMELFGQMSECDGNASTAMLCRISLVTGTLKKVKDTSLPLLHKVLQDALDLKTCLAAAAAPAKLAELSAIHGDVQTMVEQGADLMNALTADANRYHSLAAMSPGAECFHTAWDAFIATVYRAHDINMKVRDLAMELFGQMSECDGNASTAMLCRISLLTGTLKKVFDLKDTALPLLHKVLQDAVDLKTCLAAAAAPHKFQTTFFRERSNNFLL